MRVEPFGVGSVVHVIQRGGKGADIVRDVADRLRFAKSLYYLNDTHTDPMWHRTIFPLPAFDRPPHWPEREPLVHILGWTLLSNHFHLLLQEIRENGIAKFMQRLCGSVTLCFNRKYQEQGRLFQSSYRGRTVSGDGHFNYLAFYILVKNTLEMYPGGLAAAYANFDDAWRWAVTCPFSSLRDTITFPSTPILNDPDGLVGSVIGFADAFKNEARDLLKLHMTSRGETFSDVMLEPW